MTVRTILTLLGKEYKLLFRNSLFLIFSVALLIVLVGLFYVLPAEINQEEPTVAVYSEVDATAFFHAWDEGVTAVKYARVASAEALNKAVENGDYSVGFIITANMWRYLQTGNPAEVTLFTSPGLADEYVRSISFVLEIVFSEMTYRTQDSPLLIKTEEIFVGDDIMANTIPFKQRMVPLMVSLLLVMEVFTLGISLVEEKENRSIKAVLAAPVSMSEFLFAKSFAGVSVIFIQILIFLIAVGSLTSQMLAVFWVVLAGALLTTGISALLAAFSTDMMSLVSKGIFAMIVMIFPLFGILFPGMLSSWMRIIPTYMLADSLSLLMNNGAASNETLMQICVLTIVAAPLFVAGIDCIRRKVQCQ
ncbi:MAG: ABC transporter permease [Ruminiclostridium sp.]|nr:ABC transporter permease [Ruminiclostridium sp.]